MTTLHEMADQCRREIEEMAESMRREELREAALVGGLCVLGSVLAVTLARFVML
jgi:uncharacterized protein YukE